MISKEEIEKAASEAEPFHDKTDKELIVCLISKICAIKDAETLRNAFNTALRCAHTLNMNFDALQTDNNRHVCRATVADTIFPVLKVLIATYSIKKKFLVATGALAEIAAEKHVKL